MSLKEEIREKAFEVGFQLFGVSDINKLEEAEFPDDRGLMRPSEVMPEAKSAFVMGLVLWDEGLNTAISSVSTGDFSGGEADYYNMYYEVTETRGWRLVSWLNEKGYKAIPTHLVQEKIAATLAGLGFIGHNTQVITPEYGPRVRWMTVLTDAELEPDEPFTRDLCAEQLLCQEKSLCVKSCPYSALIPGPSQGVEPGKKLIYDKCVVSHEFDKEISSKHEKHIRRITERGFMECTICNLVCPYGYPVDENVIPEKRGD
ncbi:epoxyqueuosine reductase [Methanolobus bombayensis]|uniref:epoxyqueuosine reductase n=1 Tax=Methanolobus bombayensis TaxID=38023 RepID=UPI001AE78CDF|nr:epoxyqueuosine reductase [Methanolobus bombayensis]MBP1908590.1 epoxyqueuosine reductase [Methanolobus bombayensis]